MSLQKGPSYGVHFMPETMNGLKAHVCRDSESHCATPSELMRQSQQFVAERGQLPSKPYNDETVLVMTRGRLALPTADRCVGCLVLFEGKEMTPTKTTSPQKGPSFSEALSVAAPGVEKVFNYLIYSPFIYM
jgi:RHH-type rel operon transcriptional repressor/antitoxin RelB